VPCAPSAIKFASTFAAPPRWIDSRRTSTTGTGASGEIRVTSPQTNSSSITSPSTTTFRSRSVFRISVTRILVNMCQRLINGWDDPVNRHAQNALGLRKLVAEVTGTRLAGHGFIDHCRSRFVPRTPVRDVRRAEDYD